MEQKKNEYGQPIGETLPNWSPRRPPDNVSLLGSFCALEPLNAQLHGADLFEAYSTATDGADWTYMFAGPFEDFGQYQTYVNAAAASTDPKHYAVIDPKLGKAVGTLSLMRIDPNNGVIEVGNVAFSPLLKQTPASTEAQFLLMQYVFDELRYRRYEWKCDALNAPSRKAADRLGFTFEGIFRQAVIYKGRSRDTAWFSITDAEWLLLKSAYQAWLSSENFFDDGRQRRSLSDIRAALKNRPTAS